MKTWILVVAVALAALSTLLWERHDRAEDSARMEQELKALAQRVELQSQQSASEVGATRRRFEQLAVTTPATVAPVARPLFPAADPQSVAPASPAAVDIDPEAMADHLESSFFHEGPDHEWAELARRSIQEKVVSLLPEGSSIRSLECQSTLCRMELIHGNNETYRQFQHRQFQDGPLWKGASVTRTEKGPRDGEILTVSYFAREGYPLSLPDAVTH
jgi:hypothetical protein